MLSTNHDCYSYVAMFCFGFLLLLDFIQEKRYLYFHISPNCSFSPPPPHQTFPTFTASVPLTEVDFPTSEWPETQNDLCVIEKGVMYFYLEEWKLCIKTTHLFDRKCSYYTFTVTLSVFFWPFSWLSQKPS